MVGADVTSVVGFSGFDEGVRDSGVTILSGNAEIWPVQADIPKVRARNKRITLEGFISAQL
jgi:hypothetical protein